MLQHKKIILGVCGGIAAYKSAELVRLLKKSGAEVKVVMTRAATDFVTARTLSVLSENEVCSEFFDATDNWNNHVHLAEWADLFLIAPLTANTLSKMASGACDNLLMAVYLSARCKVMIAPAMDLEMYRHETVKKNLAVVAERGVLVIPAEKGALASGLYGEGRMAEPQTILQSVKEYYGASLPFKGKKVLVNAGPTFEAIDPVRFIGNRSSGKMGSSLANRFAEAGAEVTLVLGPAAAGQIRSDIKLIQVETAGEMFTACMELFSQSSIIICSAAVADYRPEKVQSAKIKKSDDALTIRFVRTPDILAEMGRRKKAGQILVGFALETDQLEKYAEKKLKEKNLDLIVANQAIQEDGGFGSDNNQVTLIDKNNKITKFELKSKAAVAKDIIDYLSTLI